MRGILLFSIFINLSFLGVAYPQHTKIQINHPPLTFPEFGEGCSKNWRLGIDYMSARVTGLDRFPEDSSVQLSESSLNTLSRLPLSLWGLGLSLNMRPNYNNIVAFSIITGVYTIGDSRQSEGVKIDIEHYHLPLKLNLEFQLFKKSNSSVILFSGANLDISRSVFSLKYIYIGKSYDNIDTLVTAIGFNAGVQLSAILGVFRFSPFAVYHLNIGRASWNISNKPVDVSKFAIMSYGIDIYFIPLKITLSCVSQKMVGHNDNATLFQLSF